MKKKYLVEGYAYNLKENVSCTYYEDEIFQFEGEKARLNGACMCVSNRRQDNPRFRVGKFTIKELST